MRGTVVLKSSSNPILLEFNDLTMLYATYFHVIMLLFIYLQKLFHQRQQILTLPLLILNLYFSLLFFQENFKHISSLLLKTLSTDKYSCLIQHVSLKFCLFLGQEDSVQGDPDFQSFQSPYFYFRESTLSDLAPSLAICLYVYITICTPPPSLPSTILSSKQGEK